MLRNREARLGFTLTEVLMAMFVMAIGMISLLALFPVAFQSAKWALDNEQVARGAANAQAMTEMPRLTVDAAGMVSMKAQSIRNDDLYNPDAASNSMSWKKLAFDGTMVAAVRTDIGAKLGRTTFLAHYDNVTDPLNPKYRWTFSTNTISPVNGAKVKFPPVFVDPLVADSFFYDFGGLIRIPYHVGADSIPPTLNPFRTNYGIPNVAALLRPDHSIGIPRMSMTQFRTLSLTDIRRQLELKLGDELTFGTSGQPVDGNNKTYGDPLFTGTFGRQSRFTWAYMCQWPDYNTPEICDVTVAVFNSRPELNGLASLPPGERTYTANTLIFNKGLTQVTIPLGATPQPIDAKVGDWILDSTFILPGYDPANPLVTAPFLDVYSTVPVNGLLPGLVGGHFYKVLDISAVQGASPNFYQTITIDRPAKSDGFSATTMMGIADVITKGVGRMPQH